MKFEWDENKRQSTIQKHDADLTLQDNRFDYREKKYITMGLLRNIVIVVAHTEVDEIIRLISMRKATKNEQTLFLERFTY